MAVEDRTTGASPSVRRAATVKRYIPRVHTFLHRLTGGALGGRMGRRLVLLLTTTVRKTGKKHTIPLLYLADGDFLITVASNGGAPTHPNWWLNLQANAEAQVQVGHQKLLVTARQVGWGSDAASGRWLLQCTPAMRSTRNERCGRSLSSSYAPLEMTTSRINPTLPLNYAMMKSGKSQDKIASGGYHDRESRRPL